MLELLALYRVASAFSHTILTYLRYRFFNKMDACNMVFNDAPADVSDMLTMTTLEKLADQPAEPTDNNDHENAVLVTTTNCSNLSPKEVRRTLSSIR